MNSLAISLVLLSAVFHALQTEPASYVVGTRQVSILLAVVIGGKMLQEKHRLIRGLAAGIIFLGVVMIAFA